MQKEHDHRSSVVKKAVHRKFVVFSRRGRVWSVPVVFVRVVFLHGMMCRVVCVDSALVFSLVCVNIFLLCRDNSSQVLVVFRVHQSHYFFSAGSLGVH